MVPASHQTGLCTAPITADVTFPERVAAARYNLLADHAFGPVPKDVCIFMDPSTLSIAMNGAQTNAASFPTSLGFGILASTVDGHHFCITATSTLVLPKGCLFHSVKWVAPKGVTET